MSTPTTTLQNAASRFSTGKPQADKTIAVRKPRLQSLRDHKRRGCMGILFGPSGSGKSTAIVDLAVGNDFLQPQKIVYINADIGDGGYDALYAGFKNRKAINKLDNLRYYHVQDYLEAVSLLENFWDEEMMTYDPDIVVFEGMTTFLGVDLVDYILDNSSSVDSNELREQGLGVSKVGKDPYWEARKRGTVRVVDLFGTLAPSPKTGKALDKILTMFEGTVQKPNDPTNPTAGSKQVLNGMPLLSGYGVFDQFKGAASWLIKCKVRTEGAKKVFTYVTAPGEENKEAKVREVPDLEPEMGANAPKLLSLIRKASETEGGGLSRP